MVLGILALIYSLSSLIFRVLLGELFNYLVCLSDSIIPVAIIVSINTRSDRFLKADRTLLQSRVRDAGYER